MSTAPTTIRSYGPNGGGATLRTGISGGLSVPAAASGSTIDSTVTIQSQYYDYTIDTGSGANTASGDLVVNGSLTGGNVVKAGAGSLRLNGSVGVSSITVNAGTLQVDTGIGTATSLTVANTATLAGVADFFYYGPTLQSGSTLAPGDNGIGTMTFYNVFNTIVDFPDALTLVPGSTTVMEVSKSGSTLTNDVLKILSGTLTYGGSLRVTNIGVGVLAAGDSFRLFDAPRIRLVILQSNPACLVGQPRLEHHAIVRQRHHHGCEWWHEHHPDQHHRLRDRDESESVLAGGSHRLAFAVADQPPRERRQLEHQRLGSRHWLGQHQSDYHSDCQHQQGGILPPDLSVS